MDMTLVEPWEMMLVERKVMRVLRWVEMTAPKKERYLVELMVHYLVPTKEDSMELRMVYSLVCLTADYWVNY